MNSTEEHLYTVSQVAEIFHVSVRTLRYWEEIGLLTPARNTFSNYRLYGTAECTRIEQILIYQATGMKLAEIKDLLKTPASRIRCLQQQRRLLLERKSQVDGMIQALDTLLEDEMNEQKLTPEEIGEILGTTHFADYQAEAEEKHGATEEWLISQQRTNGWSTSDWQEQKKRFETIDANLVRAVQKRLPPTSQEAQALVEEHRKVLSKFFPVSPTIHYLISRSYVADERFRQYYESQQEGLAQWLADAIASNAAAYGVDLTNLEWG